MGSRICVKNLPKYVNEQRLKDFFSEKGEVTDAKLIRTREGKNRQFAFIGFRTEEEAEEAIKYFNKSYLDTCRITCELAWKVGSTEIPRPWSHYSKEKREKSTPITSVKAKSNNKNIDDDKNINDPKLREFLQVMQPRSKSKLWANDLVGVEESKPKPRKHNEDENNGKIDEVSDMEYFKSRVKKQWSDSESGSDDDGSDIDEDGEDNDDGSNREGAEKTSSNREDSDVVIHNNRLYVRNLPYAATEDELAELFGTIGNVSEVHLVIDKETKQSKGFAFVRYRVLEDAYRALEELDHSFFQGRILHVIPADEDPSYNKETVTKEVKPKTFKEQRLEEKKASEAAGNTQAWNSLFMRSDTIVENIARKYGVNKSDFLDREADDVAVRIALGETQIIADTKKALANAGVNVTSLEELASGKREGVKTSNHVILIKNLPYSSTESDLSKMFSKFGSIDKIIFPPTRTLALVIFLEAAEARAAMHVLRYKRYKDAPLYLEWAPSNILDQDLNPRSDMVVGEQEVKKVLLEQVEGIAYSEIDPDRLESRSIYVKNLNFKTADEGLRKHFNDNMKGGRILSVRINKHLKNGKNVSMGFGFVEFDSVETATNVCRDLQGTVLDGHALTLRVSHAKDEKVVHKVGNDQSSTKIIVRNVAFEATEKDLRQLFSPFGQIKSLRLPMRFGKHRGFAFIEFVTKQEAQNALNALANTHLYGRHLVLGRAKEGETLDELRARTAAQFANDEGISNRIAKKRKITGSSD